MSITLTWRHQFLLSLGLLGQAFLCLVLVFFALFLCANKTTKSYNSDHYQTLQEGEYGHNLVLLTKFWDPYQQN